MKFGVKVPLTLHSIQLISYVCHIYFATCFDLTGHHRANSTFIAHLTVVSTLSTIGIWILIITLFHYRSILFCSVSVHCLKCSSYNEKGFF
jgi:hypothetical protein